MRAVLSRRAYLGVRDEEEHVASDADSESEPREAAGPGGAHLICRAPCSPALTYKTS